MVVAIGEEFVMEQFLLFLLNAVKSLGCDFRYLNVRFCLELSPCHNWILILVVKGKGSLAKDTLRCRIHLADSLAPLKRLFVLFLSTKNLGIGLRNYSRIFSKVPLYIAAGDRELPLSLMSKYVIHQLER